MRLRKSDYYCVLLNIADLKFLYFIVVYWYGYTKFNITYCWYADDVFVLKVYGLDSVCKFGDIQVIT